MKRGNRAPNLGLLGRRLIRRLWPGPLIIGVTADAATSKVGQLPETIARRVVTRCGLRLRCPAQAFVARILEQSREPLLLADVPAEMAAPDARGAQLAEALGEQAALILTDGPIAFPQGPTVVRVTPELAGGWEVIRAGAIPAELIERQAVCVVVFVCTGNTCRSPLAEALCKKRLCDRLGCTPEELRKRGYMVLSAGLFPNYGGPAALEAVDVAKVYGGDLSRHRSRGLSDDLLFQADHVIGMTMSHVEALEDIAAGMPVKPRVLSPKGEDLPDPVGCELAVYETCAATIWRDLESLIDEILPPSSAGPSNA